MILRNECFQNRVIIKKASPDWLLFIQEALHFIEGGCAVVVQFKAILCILLFREWGYLCKHIGKPK